MSFLIFMSVARKVLEMKQELLRRGVDYHSSDILWHLLRTVDVLKARARTSRLNDKAIQHLDLLLESLQDFPELAKKLEEQIARYHGAVCQKSKHSVPNIPLENIFLTPGGVLKWMTTHK